MTRRISVCFAMLADVVCRKETTAENTPSAFGVNHSNSVQAERYVIHTRTRATETGKPTSDTKSLPKFAHSNTD